MLCHLTHSGLQCIYVDLIPCSLHRVFRLISKNPHACLVSDPTLLFPTISLIKPSMMRILKRAIRRLDTFTSGWPQQHVGSQDVSTWCQCNAGVFMLESSCWYDQDVGFIMLWICWFGILGLCHDLGSMWNDLGFVRKVD